MPVTASLIGGGASVLGGLIGGLVGGGQKRKGRKIISDAEKLGAFNEKVPDEITTAASQGLPSEQYQSAMKNIQQQQLTALRGAHDRRGGLGLISGIQQGTNNATLNLDVENAKARQANQFRFASWKDKIWQNNVRSKYDQQYNYGMGLLGAGNQNVSNGLDRAVAGVGMAANGLYGYGSTGVGTNQGQVNPYTKTVGSIPQDQIF